MNYDDVKMTPATCGNCGYEMDCATPVGADGKRPKPGDISICLNCGQPLVFDESTHLRMMTEKEHEALPFSARALLAKAKRLIVERGPIPKARV